MQRHIPEFYKVEVKPFAEMSMYLDTDYRTGWRPIMMSAHPDGRQAIILLEKNPGQPAQK